MPFLGDEALHYLGEFALSRIQKEYEAYIAGEENDLCLYCYLKSIDPSLVLPCHHDFKNKAIDLSNLNKRFFKVDICNDISIGRITYRKSNLTKNSFEYTDIIAKISPYAAIADRNLQVQQIFTDFFDKLV